MDIRRLIEATMQVKEEELMAEPAAETPDTGPGPDAEVVEKPEITPELVAQVVGELPELADIDQTKLLAGMTVEMEHWESAGEDINTIALIAADHIREFPEADYYAALATMEEGLQKPATEEAPAEEPVAAEEPPVEKVVPPTAKLTAIESKEEAPVEQKSEGTVSSTTKETKGS